MTRYSVILKNWVVMLLAIVFVACDNGSGDDVWSPYISKATITYSTVGHTNTSVIGNTQGNPLYTWSLTITEGGEFCTSETLQGSVGNRFILKFAENDSEEPRYASARITFSDGYTNTFRIQQLGKSENSAYERAWAEQPEYNVGNGLLHKTYFTTLGNGKRVRNYSICFDTEKKVAHWVAYPLHDIYTSYSGYEADTSGGRTNAWAFDDAVTEYSADSNGNYVIVRYDYTDPKIPQSAQANIVSGGFGNNSLGERLDRGHMLPSASRLASYQTNAQTFYATNIMPQQSTFNQQVWGTLEGKVRNAKCADTLYVVTGTLFENSPTFTSRERTITRPSHCYKLLLRTKKGTTGKAIPAITNADELMCVAFLFENTTAGASTTINQAVTSVAEIERRSGFTFFRNINPSIAEQVKSQKSLTGWGF